MDPIRDIIEAHWRASETGDSVAEHAMYSDDAVLEYPQSGERFRGRATIAGQRGGHPAERHFTVQRITGSGELWVSECVISYDGAPTHSVSIMEFEGRQVVRETQYFADPFEAPASRAALAEATAEHHAAHGASEHLPTQPAYWDERYAQADQLWSGDPNSVLVEVARARVPGRALDVGCGEGADAVWLAANGWDVTALDISAVALERAARHARDAGATIDFVHTGLVEATLPAATFDLVSAQYPVLRKTPDSLAEHILLDLVAPDGTLVIVHHAEFEVDDSERHDFNPADYVGPWDVAPLLGEGWEIELIERRPRHLTAGAGARHSEDVILVARRRD
jgi:SAM-dependent methyltransferase